MGEYEEYYCDLVMKLAHMHAHKDSKKRPVIVEQRMTNPLDSDEARELIEEASSNLDFVMKDREGIWLQQNRDLLFFLEEECNEDLEFIGCKFSHLTPPSLREDFGLPPPHH